MPNDINLINKVLVIHAMAKFTLGELIITDEARYLYEMHNIDITDSLLNHARGNWGDVSLEEVRSNDLALASNNPVLSKYEFTIHDGHMIAFNIMTTAERNSTFVFLSTENITSDCK